MCAGTTAQRPAACGSASSTVLECTGGVGGASMLLMWLLYVGTVHSQEQNTEVALPHPHTLTNRPVHSQEQNTEVAVV